MKGFIIILIFTLSLFTGIVGAQCVTVGPNTTICQNSTLSSLGGGMLNGTRSIIWSDNGAGGKFSPNATTLDATWTPLSTYSGTATLTLTATSGCTSTPVSASFTVHVTARPIATFSYLTTPYCSNEANPSPTFSGGGVAGTFSSTAGLVFVSTSSGQVNLLASTAGGYTVTNTIAAAGGCPIITANSPIAITALPAATISYIGNPFCKSITTAQSVTRNGTSGGTYSASPSGLTINSSTGAITPSSSTARTYTVTYTMAATGGCLAQTATTSVTITALPVATFSYSATPYCSNETDPLPTFSGGGVAGTFSSTTGLVFVNTSTGQVDLTASTPGTYTVTNRIPASGGCATVTATSSIEITALPAATISYDGSPYCRSITTAQRVTRTGTTGGTYTASPSGLTINASTGSITPSSSTARTYTVTYTMAATGGCLATTATTSVTISSVPTAPVVGTITQPTCIIPTGSVVMSGLPASGTWTLTSTPGGIMTSGTGTSTTVTGISVGSYTYTVTSAAGCISPSSGNVVINAPPAPAIPVNSIDCSQGFDHGVVTVTSPVGTGFEYSLDNISGPYQSSPVFSSVVNGSHYLVVRNAAGCVSTGSPFTVSCGCINPPTVTLTSSSGKLCGIAPVTVAGNTFGGTATSVTITHNGAGTVNPISATISPFSFTYTPGATDGGKTVLITVTTNNPLGAPCTEAVATYTLTVNTQPAAPLVGTITHLSCSVATGNVILNGLPSTGTWTLTRNPGAVTTSGTGTSTTVSGLGAGTYTFTVTSAEGCISVPSANVVINAQPSSPTAPVAGTITHPTCSTSTGSVVLNALPSTGTWTITRTPGAVTTSGTGTTTTISALPSGTFTFTVTNAAGCISPPSVNVIINVQPAVPSAPVIGAITAPTCTLATGSVILSGLPSTGTWTLIRYPGTISTTGTGTSTTITGIASGTYNFTVTTKDGCLSALSANVVIPAQPPIPSAPVIGTITQPTFEIPTGSVVLSGLPLSGSWIITRFPGNITTAGSGSYITITDLSPAVYSFTVTTFSGCTSTKSIEVTISMPGTPDLIITNPPAVCAPSTVDLTASGVTVGSTSGLTFTYWKDAAAISPYDTPSNATAGTYYIKGTTSSGFYNIKPVLVTIDHFPSPDAGLDQTLEYQFSTSLDAKLIENETGTWSLLSGAGEFYDITDPKTIIDSLSTGDNILLWTVTSGVCQSTFDTVNIFVKDLVIPTLITPNLDGRNDYFVLRGLSTLGKTELIIFNRRGESVFRNLDYDNKWNGVDSNNVPLPDDTYFFVLKSINNRSISGYIVIRR